ncbi:MAG: FkbM family methyltransferase [Nanoarchaeota archaeon]
MKLLKGCHNLLNEVVKNDFYKVRVFRRRVPETFVDIGANVGMFSIMVRFLFPNSRIIAIEPDPNNYAALVDNCSGLEIETVNVAIADGKPVQMIGSRSTCKRVESSDIGIPSIIFSDLVKMVKSPLSKTYLKFDCEGGEKYFLSDPVNVSKLWEFQAVGAELHPAWLTQIQWDSWSALLKQEASKFGSIDIKLVKKNAVLIYFRRK